MNKDQTEISNNAIKVLSTINVGNEMKKELFEALARLTITVAFETVAIRQNKNRVEIFLTKRGPDEAYPNQWHSPGSVMRREEDFQDVLDRLSKNEFKTKFVSNRMVGILNYKNTERGHFLCPVFLVELEQCPKIGKWFLVDKLPANTVEDHKKLLIPMALEAFKNFEKTSQLLRQ